MTTLTLCGECGEYHEIDLDSEAKRCELCKTTYEDKMNVVRLNIPVEEKEREDGSTWIDEEWVDVCNSCLLDGVGIEELIEEVVDDE